MGTYLYKVVLVDDEPFVIEDLKSAIDWEGYDFEIVYTSTSSTSVLDYISNNSVDLLITDISMPQINGIELIHSVKKLNSQITILVLSAYDNFDFVRTALRNGAENYLLKPLDPNELAESIRSIAEHLPNRATPSNAYGLTMLNFRSIFVENWVRNALDHDDFITRANMLSINLQLNNFTVIILTTNQATTQKMAALLEGVLSLFLLDFQSHFFFEDGNKLVCILSSNGAPHDRQIICKTIDSIRSNFSFPIFFVIGNTVDNYEDVSESYRKAHRYLFYDLQICRV